MKGKLKNLGGQIRMKGKFRILGRLGLALVVISALLLMAAPVAAATAVTSVWVEFPTAGHNNVSTAALYHIHFTPTTAMNRGVDTITVIFPTAFDLSGAQTAAAQYSMKVGTTTTVMTSVATIGGQRIQVTTPVDLAAGTAVELIVAAGAVIKTGSSAAFTGTIKLATSKDTTLVTSSAFPVDNTALTAVEFKTGYPSSLVAGATAAYDFEFTPAASTAIGKTVTVRFPTGTYLPATISTEYVKVGNGSEDPAPSVVVVDQAASTVTVTTAETLTNASMNIYFLSGAGIKNPSAAANIGTIKVAIWTNVDGKIVDMGTGYTVVAGPASKLVFRASTSDNATIINAFTQVLKLEAQDQYGNLATGESTTVLVSVTTGTGAVHTAAGSSANLWGSSQALSSGVDDVFYRPTTAGTHTLTATKVTGTTMTAGTIDITVAEAVTLKDANDNTIATYKPAATVYTADLMGGTYVQQAITAAFPGDTVELGTGIYELSSALSLSTKITLTEASGASATLRPTTNDLDAIIVAVSGTAAYPVVIDGLTFDRLKSGTDFSRAVYNNGYNYLTVTNNTFNYVIPTTNADDQTGGSVVSYVIDNQERAGAAAITSGTISNNIFTNCALFAGYSGGESAIINIMTKAAAASGLTITGVTISGNTLTNNNGIGISLNGYDGANNDSYVTATVSNNTITNITQALSVQRDTVSVKILGNTITDTYSAGLWVEAKQTTAHTGLVVKNNTFTGVNGGLKDTTYLSTGRAVIHIEEGETPVVQYNAIYDNLATYAIKVSTTPTLVDAKYNWFGSASSPAASISGLAADVIYTPWLHKSLVDVVADNASYPTFSRSLVVGWNTLSVPGKLISTADALDELVPTGMTIAYRYDDGWLQITTAVINPLDGIYIKMASAQTVLLKVDGAAFSTPTKSLVAGWNLVGLASLTSKTDILAIGSLPSTSFGQMVSPSMNASEWVYVSGSTAGTLAVGEGYWIFMKSAATMAGFTILPMAPSLN